MKLPGKAPDLKTVRASFTPEFVDKVSAVLRKANNEYLDWDDFKQISLPRGIAPEQAWGLLKMSRSLQYRFISLADANQIPFRYWLPDCVHRDIHVIDQQARSSALACDPSISHEEKRRFMMRSLVDEAIASSGIQGATTGRAVAKEMLRTGREPVDGPERMILNNYEALQMIKEHLPEALTRDFMGALHAEITKDTFEDRSGAGRFRTRKDGAARVFDTDGKTILHEAPDAGRVPDLIEELCEFANSDAEDEFVNPVVRGILLHFWLAYVHPFMDGNGRTARALFYWYMLKHGYWIFDYVSVSTAILNTRAQYYRSFLYSERDGNDVTHFIVYNLKAIHQSIDLLHDYIRTKQKEKKYSYRVAARYSSLNPRQRMLLASAFEKPGETYVIETHANVQGVTYQTARTDLLGLKSLGLLEMKKEGKKFVFRPVSNLAKKLEG